MEGFILLLSCREKECHFFQDNESCTMTRLSVGGNPLAPASERKAAAGGFHVWELEDAFVCFFVLLGTGEQSISRDKESCIVTRLLVMGTIALHSSKQEKRAAEVLIVLPP